MIWWSFFVRIFFWTYAYAVHREWSGADLSGVKKFRITLIVAICAAIGVAAFSRLYVGRTLPEHDPGTAELQEHAAEETEGDSGEQTEFVLGEEVFLSAVEEALGGQLEVSDLSAEIGENGVVLLSGSVNKSDAAALLKEQDDSISSAYLSVLDLLPDSLPLQLELTLCADGGAVAVVPKSLKVATMEIPDTVVGADAFNQLETSINRSLAGKLSRVESISSADGKLTVTGAKA